MESRKNMPLKVVLIMLVGAFLGGMVFLIVFFVFLYEDFGWLSDGIFGFTALAIAYGIISATLLREKYVIEGESLSIIYPLNYLQDVSLDMKDIKKVEVYSGRDFFKKSLRGFDLKAYFLTGYNGFDISITGQDKVMVLWLKERAHPEARILPGVTKGWFNLVGGVMGGVEHLVVICPENPEEFLLRVKPAKD